MKIKLMKTEIVIPDGITSTIDNNLVTIKGSKGEVQRSFLHPRVVFKLEGDKIILESKDASKREKTMHNTFRAHLKNMFKGAAEGHIYKLKICSGHFPMNVAVNNGEFVIKNFLGEKVPRVLKIKEGADVKLEGDQITVTSGNKETAGQVAADIEKLTTIKGRDLRIFQDGIYITDKDGKQM